MEKIVGDLKEKIMKKLPEILPKVVKSVVVHIVMFIYHVSMPPWVTAIKIKKALSSHNVDRVNNEYYKRIRRNNRNNRRS